jgi:gamma-glutamyltranspeptidase/glutathione hydrolase
MVVAGHHLAAMAAMRLLEAGGNAVDAGVAAGFALNVVQPDMANLGGVAPITLYDASRQAVTTINGVGTWPKGLTREELARSGGGTIPNDLRRWVVPAAVDAWLTALERYGTRSLAEVLAPAIELAAHGFATNYFTHHNLRVAEPEMTAWAHTREVYYPNGRVPAIGEPIVQTALAETLQSLVDAERQASGDRREGVRAARDRFYRGDLADRIGAFAREAGGYLTTEDLRAFAVREVAPVRTRYRDHDVYACGPWSQGPVVLQALNVLEGFDLKRMAPADAVHVMIEAVELGLNDRNHWYGDPDAVDVPMDRLLSRDHADGLRRSIDLARVGAPFTPHRPGATSPDTTYVAVVDRHGNAFSATPSDSTILYTPMVPGLGFAISNRGGQSSLDPRSPNVMAPGKRPRLTPNPGLVLGQGTVMPYGTPGGDVQTQAMVQFLVQVLDLEVELQAAVEAARWASYAVPVTEDPHPAKPHLVRVEAPLHDLVGDELARKGHVVERWPSLAADAGGICAVRLNTTTGVLAGAGDPRRMSYGIGW